MPSNQSNRLNSLKSTGPRTKEGKAAVRLNALWHGGCAADLLLPGEDPVAFESLRDSLYDHFRPSNPSEEFLVNRLLLAAWRLHRLAAMEVRVLNSGAELRPGLLAFIYCFLQKKSLPEEDPSDEPEIKDPIATAFIRDTRSGNALVKLARHQAALERSYYRAVRELDRLRSPQTRE